MIVLAEVIAKADAEWTSLARPIVKAMLLVDEAHGPVRSAWLVGTKSDQCVMDEAKRYVGKAYEALSGMLDGIRDNVYCDHCMPVPVGDDEDECSRRDEYNDNLHAGIMSVDSFVKMVEGEDF